MTDIPIFKYDHQPEPPIPWTPVVGMEGFIEHEDGSRTPFTVGEVIDYPPQVVLFGRDGGVVA